MTRKYFPLTAALVAAVAFSGCRRLTEPTPPPTIPNISFTCIGNSCNSVPQGGTSASPSPGTGSTTCAAIADIGGKLYGSNETRQIAIRVGQTATADFTPKDKDGKIRGGDCDKNTDVTFATNDTSVCRIIENPSNHYLPGIQGVKAGSCWLRATADGITTSADKDVEVTVSAATLWAPPTIDDLTSPPPDDPFFEYVRTGGAQ
jgi:hypothetical protein